MTAIGVAEAVFLGVGVFLGATFIVLVALLAAAKAR